MERVLTSSLHVFRVRTGSSGAERARVASHWFEQEQNRSQPRKRSFLGAVVFHLFSLFAFLAAPEPGVGGSLPARHSFSDGGFDQCSHYVWRDKPCPFMDKRRKNLQIPSAKPQKNPKSQASKPGVAPDHALVPPRPRRRWITDHVARSVTPPLQNSTTPSLPFAPESPGPKPARLLRYKSQSCTMPCTNRMLTI